jgi:hypothetical protein
METLLTEILQELRKLTAPPLGFNHPPKPRYVYANRQYSDCLWYFWNGGKNEHEPIAHHALTGAIERIEIETKEFRGKPDIKVNLHIRGDRFYVLQSGFDTLFAKGLLWSLDQLPSLTAGAVLTIAVEPGDTEQVLFCRVYGPDGQSIYAPYPDTTDWVAIAASVQSKLGGESVKPEPKKVVPVSPAPEFKANPLSGQGELISDESGGIVDRLNRLIKQMGAQEIDGIGGTLAEWRERLGENAYDLLYRRWDARAKQLGVGSIDRAGVIAAISVEMQLLEWSNEKGSLYLQSKYGKKKRSELTDSELLEFLGQLKELRTEVAF